MGTSNFNVKQSVENYINKISRNGSLTGSDIAELTAHLYDAVDGLKNIGLSDEEAFVIASKRLGNETVITEEYNKVNASLSTGKIWSYLLIGFNMFYILPSFAFLGANLFYLYLHDNYQNTYKSGFIASCFHLLVIAGIIYIVSRKSAISGFIEQKVRYNPIRVVLWSFAPGLLLYFVNKTVRANLVHAFNYPLREFGPLCEFTLILVEISIIFGLLAIVFTLNNQDRFRLKSIFEKPTILFLLIFGSLLEFGAAATRMLTSFYTIQTVALVFGLVYFAGAFLISFYNRQSSKVRYLVVFALPGIVLETVVGIGADMRRGDTYFTVYFVASILLYVLLARILALKFAKKELEHAN